MCDTYCCNHGCNQGRACPARVAKVKQRYPKQATPLRAGFTWRRNLKHLAKWMLISLAASMTLAGVGCVARII